MQRRIAGGRKTLITVALGAALSFGMAGRALAAPAWCGPLPHFADVLGPQLSNSSRTPAEDSVFRAQHGGLIRRSQLEAMQGLTVDQAKLELKKLGHVGRVSVRRTKYTPGCADNRVCLARTEHGGDTSFDDELFLELNPAVTIAPPPP